MTEFQMKKIMTMTTSKAEFEEVQSTLQEPMMISFPLRKNEMLSSQQQQQQQRQWCWYWYSIPLQISSMP